MDWAGATAVAKPPCPTCSPNNEAVLKLPRHNSKGQKCQRKMASRFDGEMPESAIILEGKHKTENECYKACACTPLCRCFEYFHAEKKCKLASRCDFYHEEAHIYDKNLYHLFPEKASADFPRGKKETAKELNDKAIKWLEKANLPPRAAVSLTTEWTALYESESPESTHSHASDKPEEVTSTVAGSFTGTPPNTAPTDGEEEGTTIITGTTSTEHGSDGKFSCLLVFIALFIPDTTGSTGTSTTGFSTTGSSSTVSHTTDSSSTSASTTTTSTSTTTTKKPQENGNGDHDHETTEISSTSSTSPSDPSSSSIDPSTSTSYQSTSDSTTTFPSTEDTVTSSTTESTTTTTTPTTPTIQLLPPRPAIDVCPKDNCTCNSGYDLRISYGPNYYMALALQQINGMWNVYGEREDYKYAIGDKFMPTVVCLPSDRQNYLCPVPVIFNGFISANAIVCPKELRLAYNTIDRPCYPTNKESIVCRDGRFTCGDDKDYPLARVVCF